MFKSNFKVSKFFNFDTLPATYVAHLNLEAILPIWINVYAPWVISTFLGQRKAPQVRAWGGPSYGQLCFNANLVIAIVSFEINGFG